MPHVLEKDILMRLFKIKYEFTFAQIILKVSYIYVHQISEVT